MWYYQFIVIASLLSDFHALVTPDNSPSGAVRSLSIAEVGLMCTKMWMQ